MAATRCFSVCVIASARGVALYTTTLTRDGSWLDSGAWAKYDTECVYMSGDTYPTTSRRPRLFAPSDLEDLEDFGDLALAAPTSSVSSSLLGFDPRTRGFDSESSSSESTAASPKLRADGVDTARVPPPPTSPPNFASPVPPSPAPQSSSRSLLGARGGSPSVLRVAAANRAPHEACASHTSRRSPDST